MPPPLTRRALMKGLVALGMATLRGRAGAAIEPEPGRDLARLLPHPESARALGAAYLQRRPEEADRAVLLARLGLGSAHIPAEAVVVRHRADFRAGRVLTLRGWTLSLTELRLCALASLAPAGTSEPRGAEFR